MTSQEPGHTGTPYDIRPPRRHTCGPKGHSHDDADLGFSTSNRAVGLTLAIGIGMMLIVLMLPYVYNR